MAGTCGKLGVSNCFNWRYFLNNPQVIGEWLTSLSIIERAKALNLVSFKLTVRDVNVVSLPRWRSVRLAG